MVQKVAAEGAGFKPRLDQDIVRQFSLLGETVRHIWLLLKLPAICCFLLRLLPRNMASCRDCPRDCASCRERQKKELRGQSPRKPFIMYNGLSRKQEIADSLVADNLGRKLKYAD